MNAPLMFHYSQFMDLVQHLAQDSRPMKLRLFYPYTFWNELEQKHKTLENGIEFKNKAMVNSNDFDRD